MAGGLGLSRTKHDFSHNLATLDHGKGIAPVRQVERGVDVRALTAGAVMHANPKRIGPDALAAEGADLMEQHRITSLAVADAEGRLVGMLTIGDLMRAKVV